MEAAVFRSLFQRTVRRGLRGVWLRGELPPGPLVVAPNHHSWWDAYVLPVWLWALERPFVGLVEPETLKRFPFARSLGALSSAHPREALRALRDRVVVVFPEGRLSPPGTLAPLQEGAAWLASKAGVPLIPLALGLLLRGAELPEAYLWVGSPVPPKTEALREALEGLLTTMREEAKEADPEAPLPGYSLLVAGRKSAHERMAFWAGLLGRLKGSR